MTTRTERLLLSEGTLEIRGRIMPASNATFLAESVTADAAVRCVYKPIAGERPLWDFPNGPLAHREVAAYVVSEALGWGVVPLTLLREGPHGPGMVQLWCEPEPEPDTQERVQPVDLCPVGQLPPGYLHVLDAEDGEGNDVSLAHESSSQLRRMAVFDVVVNNADRKGGHVLAMSDQHRYGVDHGICFHSEDKLRTVLWGWAAEPLHPEDGVAVAALVEELTRPTELRRLLDDLLVSVEVDAIIGRCSDLLASGRMPVPSGRWPAIPWPAF